MSGAHTAGSGNGHDAGWRGGDGPGAPTLRLAQQPEADALLSRSPLALVLGSLLDQQVPMERAFAGPLLLAQRLGRSDLDAAEIAGFEPEEFAALFSAKPAVHRFPGSMAGRVQRLCRYLVDHYDGDASRLWRGVGTGTELRGRLQELPGFGRQKAEILVALLGKQLGVTPEGWRAAAGRYGADGVHRSVADVTGPETLERVRTTKQAEKQAAKRARNAAGGRTEAGPRAARQEGDG